MAAAPCARVPGLDELLASIGLEEHADNIASWCEQMGARFLYELGEDENAEDLANDLKLKPLEKKRLVKALRAVPSQAPAVTAGYAAAASASVGGISPVAAAALPVGFNMAAQASGQREMVSSTKPTIFVRNTFLDLNDDERPEVLRRLHTAPAPQVAGAEEDDYFDEEDDEDCPEAAEQPAPLAGHAIGDRLRTMSYDDPGLYRTCTWNGYDDVRQWDWTCGAPPMAPLAPVAEARGPMSSGMMPDLPPGVVMLPAEACNPYGIPGMQMIPAAGFPGCVAVPMGRFERWPGNMPVEAAMGPRVETKKNVLHRAASVSTNIQRVRWTVDARKLKSKDTEAVSPPFELAFERSLEFKIVLRPRITSDTKGGASFKAARGKGVVELRCLDEVDASVNPLVTFQISIGSPADAKKQRPPRGPVVHNFADRSICGLEKGQDEWDFSKVVDKETKTFVVVLEVLSGLSSTADKTTIET
eukprot:TRINITY_DN52162_c0_g1_i2.p1 TRINITY_DN52162_c0_g1~~TRINITY_DN52162_c0_g1_i2.p1  ORF type:complete len:473 (-),score=124.79 TRINITY_DN52162_c0_g1_i2:218-1636(-)